MRDRREHSRYEMAARPAGELRYLSPVEVVSVNSHEYLVIADEACAAGEEVLFHEPARPALPVAVRIEACRPVLMNDRLRFEMRLRAEPAVAEVEAGA